MADEKFLHITLTARDGKQYPLNPPTPRNMIEASDLFGDGLNSFLTKCSAGNARVFLWILRSASPEDSLPGNPQAQQELLFENLALWFEDLCRWANALQHGGRAPVAVDTGAPDAGGDDDDDGGDRAVEAEPGKPD